MPAIHHLSMNVTKWLNIGLFEGVIFGRKNRFDFEYLNPLIFTATLKVITAAKTTPLPVLILKPTLHTGTILRTVLLDEFILSDKKQSHQLDKQMGHTKPGKIYGCIWFYATHLQVETNRVRLFTYSHGDSISNYTITSH